jgi:hypothetical protein
MGDDEGRDWMVLIDVVLDLKIQVIAKGAHGWGAAGARVGWGATGAGVEWGAAGAGEVCRCCRKDSLGVCFPGDA